MIARGVLVRGVLLTEDIAPKVVAAKCRIHESTLSRFFNGIKDVSDDHFLRIGIAIGEARAERKTRKGGSG
jgi:plasmid maintenance system antidote protein VapI